MRIQMNDYNRTISLYIHRVTIVNKHEIEYKMKILKKFNDIECRLNSIIYEYRVGTDLIASCWKKKKKKKSETHNVFFFFFLHSRINEAKTNMPDIFFIFS